MWHHYLFALRPDGKTDFRLLRSPSSAASRALPVTVATEQSTGAVAVVHGRFFYSPRPAEPPADVLLAAYRAAGRKGLEALEGEFSAVVWDAPTRTLIGLRDPFGGGPLFWWSNPAGCGFSTDLRAARAASESVGVDREYLAEFLSHRLGLAEPATERTPAPGVSRVVPGVRVELASDREPTRVAYWDWAEMISSVPVTSVGEAAEGLRAVLRAAIQERVVGRRSAAHLSGGLDSTAVVALAVAEAGPARVRTVSLVYGRGELAGEQAYITAAIDHLGLSADLLEADEVLDYDLSVAAAIDHAEPRAGLRGLATQVLMTEAATRSGAEQILTGVGSDELFVVPDFQLADAVRRFQWGAALSRARALAQEWNQGLWGILHENAFSVLWPVLAHDGVWPFLCGGRARWPRPGRYTVPPWVDPEFARMHRLFPRTRAKARLFSVGPAAGANARKVFAASVGDWNRAYLTGPQGLGLSHAFRDPRVVAFALGLPAWLRTDPTTVSKALLREAVLGLVPDVIRERRGKRGFDEVNGRALNRRAREIEDWLGTARVQELGVFDLVTLGDAVCQAGYGLGDAVACDRLGQALALAVWYEQWDREPVAWVVDRVPSEYKRGNRTFAVL